MKVLFVNACIRKEQSRTLALCRAYLEDLTRRHPEAVVEEVDVENLGIAPLNAQSVALRDSLIAAKDWEHPMLSHARQFAQADRIVVGAPYWDLGFPAALKVYVENVYVTGVTTRFTDQGQEGLCHADKCVYITSAGGFPQKNMGAEYLRAIVGHFGVDGFEYLSADGLDMDDQDPDALMEEALAKVRELEK